MKKPQGGGGGLDAVTHSEAGDGYGGASAADVQSAGVCKGVEGEVFTVVS